MSSGVRVRGRSPGRGPGGRRHAGRLLGQVAGLLAVAVLATWWMGPVAARAADGERITSYAVTIDIRTDASLDVTERIAYDFGATQRHGITRDIPTRERADGTHDRVYHVSDVRVSSPSGAPAAADAQDNGRSTFLRIGDPDQTVTGEQTYEIRYHLEGALNSQPTLDELYWDAIGDNWDVPVTRGTVDVTVPDGIERLACFSDPGAGSTACGEAVRDDAGKAHFAQSDLRPGQALTIVVGIRKGVVTVPPPELAADPTSSGALGGSQAESGIRWPGVRSYTGAGAAVVGALALAGFGYRRRGRDQLYLGLPYGMVPATTQPGTGPATAMAQSQALVGYARRPEIAPEFQPPAGVGPGLAGTLLDERADTVDVSATVVDLAVRRQLHIEELAPPHFWNNRDWRLTRLEPPPGDQVTPAEQAVLDGLFASGESQVLMSALKYKFAKHLTTVKGLFYDEVVTRGWFHKRPDRIRRVWEIAGSAGLFGGALLGVSNIFHQRLDLLVIGAGIALAGLILRLSAKVMPARTAAGSAMLARVLGFRRYLETAEAEQLRFEEGVDIFSRYLPYAMVFGVTDRWTKVFASLAATQQLGAIYWYSGPPGFGFEHLGPSLTNFSNSTTQTLAATTSSSSSGGSGFSGGFSGGGGGGGGGGSW